MVGKNAEISKNAKKSHPCVLNTDIDSDLAIS